MYDAATYAAYPFLAQLEAAAPRMRAEVMALGEERWIPAQGYQDGVSVCVLEARRFTREFEGVALADNRAHAPVAAAVIAEIPGVQLAGYQRFLPDAGIAEHTDPRPDRMVRCILGLQLPAEEQPWWPEGRARLLDTRRLHWARNVDVLPRFTFVIDVELPFVVESADWPPWRPDAPGDLARPAGSVEEFRRARGVTRGE